MIRSELRWQRLPPSLSPVKTDRGMLRSELCRKRPLSYKVAALTESEVPLWLNADSREGYGVHCAF